MLAAILMAGLLTAQEAGPALKLSLKADRTDLVLGQEAQLHATLENPGKEDATAGQLSFDERSLVFEVTFPGPGGKPVKFLYSVVRPDPHLADRLAPRRVMVKAGRSVSGIFLVPTLATGETTVVGVYRGAEKELRSNPVKLAVSDQGGNDRLAAVLATSKGEITLELLPEAAPNNVANFVSLAQRGFYDNLRFHRVVKGRWIQTGCGYELGVGNNLGYAVRSEAEGQKVKHEEGTLSMAGNLKDGFTGSQFFITLKRLESLDGKFTVIGRITGDGIDTALDIGAVDVDRKTDRPREDVVLKEVKIIAVKKP